MWRPVPSRDLRRAGSVEAQRRRAAGVGEVAAGQVGTAAQQFGHGLGEDLQRDLARLAAGHGLGLGVRGDHGVHRGLREAGRQLALHAARELRGELGVRGLVGGEALGPGGFGSVAGGLGVPGAVGLFGDHEGLVRPAQRLARELDLFGAQRLAVGLGGAAAVRRALADGGLADDQRRRRGRGPGLHQRGVDRGDVVAVDRADDVPAVGGEALAARCR